MAVHTLHDISTLNLQRKNFIIEEQQIYFITATCDYVSHDMASLYLGM